MAWPDITTLIDDFNRASLGASWTTGSWFGDSSLSIISSTLLGGASAWPGGFYNGATYGPDLDLIIDLPTIGGAMSVFARLDNSNSPSGYQLHDNNGLYRLDTGTATLLGLGFDLGPNDGDKIGLEIIGDTLSARKYTGGAWGVATSRTDATYSAAGYFGVEIGTNAGRMDNLSGGTIGAAFYTINITETTATVGESVTVSIEGTSGPALSINISPQTARTQGVRVD